MKNKVKHVVVVYYSTCDLPIVRSIANRHNLKYKINTKGKGIWLIITITNLLNFNSFTDEIKKLMFFRSFKKEPNKKRQ